MLDDEDSLFPKKTDRLISESGGWGIGIVNTPEEREQFLIGGYKQAADELVELALNDTTLRPKLIYPILFCYRHFVELWLKSQLHRFGSDQLLPEIRKAGHNLKILLSMVKNLDKNEITNSLNDREISYVVDFIDELHDVDPTSTSFRYREGNVEKSEKILLNIDAAYLKEVMGRVANLFLFAEDELHNILAPSD